MNLYNRYQMNKDFEEKDRERRMKGLPTPKKDLSVISAGFRKKEKKKKRGPF